MEILLIIYWVLAYMSLNKVWYSKRTYLVCDSFSFYLKKALISVLFGWILIPVALIQMVFSRK
jgi:Zn-dependent protease with chaperone function